MSDFITIDLGQLVSSETRATEVLALAKARGHARLAAAITSARTVLITVLPGQEMIYLAKEAEAKAWIETPEPDLADFPLLSAEIGLTAPDADQLAQIWLNMASLWRQTAAGLEALRLTVKASIDAATTPAEIETTLIPLREILS